MRPRQSCHSLTGGCCTGGPCRTPKELAESFHHMQVGEAAREAKDVCLAVPCNLDWPQPQHARAVRRFDFLEQLPLSRVEIDGDYAHRPRVLYGFSNEQRVPIGTKRD